MKQVAEQYQALVQTDKVRGICRFNLRKFCRSFDLPPCGISFWRVDDPNWDYLNHLNQALSHDAFWFRGGEHFPRAFWDLAIMGQDKRTEFIFLTTGPGQHRHWAAFFQRAFPDSARRFGSVPPTGDGQPAALQPLFRTQLIQDIIHFSHKPEALGRLGDFYLALTMLTMLKTIPANPTRDTVLKAGLEQFPQYRADLARVLTTTRIEDRLNDLMHAFNRLTQEHRKE